MITAKYFLDDVLDENLTIYPNEHINVSYEDLRTARPTMNYISMDGLGVDLYDDTSEFANSSDYVGYISQSISDEQNEIFDRIVLFGGSTGESFEDTFFIEHGISLGFVKDYPELVRLTAYSYDGSIALLEDIEITSLNQHIDLEPFACDRLYIDFIKTKTPNSFVKISYLVLGQIYDFKDFKSFDYVDELNLLSDDLPIGQIDFSIFANEDLIVKENSLVVFYDGQNLLGNYYLKECERETPTKYNFVVQNEISKADKVDFSDYALEPISDSNEFTWENPFVNRRPTNYLYETSDYTEIIQGELEKAFEKSKIKYEIDESLLENNDWWISPYLKKGSCRYGIQQICWALNSCVVCTDKVKVVPLSKILSKSVKKITDKDNKILKTSVSKNENISNVLWEIKSYFGTKTPSEKQLAKTTSDENGLVELSFTEPTKITRCTYGEAEDPYAFYNFQIKGSKESPYYVHLIGHKLMKYTIYGFSLGSSTVNVKIPIQEKGTEKKYSNQGLYIEEKENEKKSHLRSANEKNRILSATIVYGGEKVGDCVSIQDNFGDMFTGVITSVRFSTTATYRKADIEVQEWNL